MGVLKRSATGRSAKLVRKAGSSKTEPKVKQTTTSGRLGTVVAADKALRDGAHVDTVAFSAATFQYRSRSDQATVSAQEAAKLLREHMGRQLFALTLGVEPTSADRYLRGSRPKHDVEQRIIDAYTAWQEVSKVDAPDTVRAWFMGMKDALGDLSPAEAIAEGRGRDVMAVARAYVQRA